MSEERWLPVVGYEGLYEVSDHGRVRSVTRELIINSKGVRRVFPSRYLVGELDHGGHRRVQLCRSRHPKRRAFVHCLILEAFVGPCPPGHEACHDNGDPSDNSLGNLRWDTKSGNAQDRVRHGRDHHARRSECDLGHRLGEPNVTAEARMAGWRTCLACVRGGAYVRLHPELDKKTVTDWYYERIMSGETGRAFYLNKRKIAA